VQARQGDLWLETGAKSMVCSAMCQATSFGFMPSKADTSLFYYNKGRYNMFILVYVDDIIVVSSSPKATEAFLRDL
jgi:hypothetical protein